MSITWSLENDSSAGLSSPRLARLTSLPHSGSVISLMHRLYHFLVEAHFDGGVY